MNSTEVKVWKYIVEKGLIRGFIIGLILFVLALSFPSVQKERVLVALGGSLFVPCLVLVIAMWLYYKINKTRAMRRWNIR